MKRIFKYFVTAMLCSMASSAAMAQTREPIVLRFATMSLADSNIYKEVLAPWAARITADSGGQAKVEAIPGVALANFGNVYDRVATDTIQIGWAIHFIVAGRFPLSEVAALPGLTQDSEKASVALWRLYQSGLLDEEYKDVKPLVMIVHTQSSLHFAKKPAAPLETLKGFRVLATGRLVSDAVTRLGGAPVSIQIQDGYEALSRNTVDAVVTGWPSFGTYKLGEVTHYHVETKLSGATSMFFMTKSKFQSLPPAVQAAIEKNSGETASRSVGVFQDKEVSLQRDAVKAMPDQIIVAPTPEIQKQWASTLQPIIDDWAASRPSGTTILAKFRQILGEVH